ncbi:MAG: PAS domain S-box protein [Cyanobacteria bacterium J06635_15]
MPTHTASARQPTLADNIDVQPLQVSSEVSIAAVIAQIGRAREACEQVSNTAIAPGTHKREPQDQESLLNTNYVVVVVDDDQLVGLLTSQDLVCCLALEIDLAKTQVRTVMGPPPPQIRVDASLEAAYQLMRQYRVRQLAVCDAQQRLLGLVTQGALLRSLHRPLTHVPSPELGLGDRPHLPDQSPAERLRIQNRQQSAVASLGQRAIGVKDIDKFMTVAVRLVARILKAEYCQILELLPGRDALRLRAAVGAQLGHMGQTIFAAGPNSQAGYTLLSPAPVIVEDWATETRFDNPDLPLNPGPLNHRIVSGMSVIIPNRTRSFGVLGVHTTRHRHFSTDDVHFLQAIANILALVIERQTSERANQFQSHLLSHITDAVIATDVDHRITYWNQAAEQRYGLDAQAVCGSRVADCFDCRWLTPTDEQVMRTAVESQGRWRGKQIHRLQNGAEHLVEVTISTLPDERGTPAGRLTTIRDIDDNWSKAALLNSEAALHHSEVRLSLITDALPACISYIDADLRYRFVNKTYETWFALDRQAIYGRYLWEVIGEAAYEKAKPQIDRVFRGKRVTYEMVVPYAQGTRHISGTLIPDIGPNSKVRGYYALIIDISDYKRTEAYLRQNEAALTKAQEIAHIGSWEFDLTTQTLACSTEMFRLFGLDSTAPPPTLAQIAQFFTPGDWAQVQQSVQQLIATGESQPFKGRIVRPGGELRHLEGSSEAIKNAQGKVVKLLGTAMDVTERQQRQDQLQLLEAVIFNTNDAVLITEADPIELPGPRIIYANPAFTAMSGYTNAEIIGQTPRLLQGSNTDRAVLKQIRTALRTHQKIRVELLNYRKDGSEFWIELGLMPITNAAGQATHFVAIQRDISERKRNQQKLQEQAELIDIATDAFLVRDLDSRLLFWSRGAERIYGWGAEEALGQNVDQLLNSDLRQVQAAWQAVLHHGEWQGELSKSTKTKDARIIESRWTLVRDPAGNPKAVLSVDTDITERKQLETQFLRAQRLESLGTLASGIAHDLNNILTPILGIAQILPLQLKDAKPSVLELLTILRTTAKRGAALSKQILTFAQGADSEFKALNLNYIIREVKQFAQKTFPKSIAIRVNAPKDLWMLMGDATHLYQVLMNLCVNARDAMPQGGDLSLSAQNLWLNETHLDLDPGPYVVVEVADAGIGIAPERLEQIFDPFFTTKEPGKGTGLGLFTVAKIIKGHHGQIQVTSQENQGTRFTIYLPAAPIELSPAESEPHLRVGAGELILVIDDEAQIRRVTQDLLETYHYRVLTARDGPEAIALYKAHAAEIDGVLIDIHMPKMSGAIALEALQRINPQLKVVVTSGVMSNEQLVIRESLNVQAFLPKPYSVEDLLKAMHTALQA